MQGNEKSDLREEGKPKKRMNHYNQGSSYMWQKRKMITKNVQQAMPPKACSMKKIIERPNLIKIKNVYTVEENVKRMRRQAIDLGENICKKTHLMKMWNIWRTFETQ